MLRATGLIVIATLTIACADVRVGLQSSPIGAVNSDEAVLSAIRHALSSDERACQIDVVTLENTPQDAESTRKQVASVIVCGRPQRFSIQHSQIDADSVLIAAKRI